MKKSEIKKFTKDQALKNLDKLKKDLFNLRFQKTNGQLSNPSKISQTKKDISRMKYVNVRYHPDTQKVNSTYAWDEEVQDFIELDKEEEE